MEKIEKTIVKLCPRCGRPMKVEHDEAFDTEVMVCEKCDWRFYKNTEKYTFVVFKPGQKGGKKRFERRAEHTVLEENEE